MTAHVTKRLAALRNRAGLSMGELAKALGYKTASGYQRYEDPAEFKKEHLPVELTGKLLSALVGRGKPPIRRAEVLSLSGLPDGGPLVGSMPVEYKVAATGWLALDELQQDPLGFIPISMDSRYPHRRQYAVLVEGDSMNIKYPSGAYVIVMDGFGQLPRHGDVVIARQTRRGMVQRTLKRVNIENGTIELRPESTDPKFKPLIMGGDEDDNVEIEAYVIGKYEQVRPD